MKRVIDVSDTLYQTCKRLVSEGDARPSECCIANSEPYEPSGECETCGCRLFTDKFTDNIVGVMVKYGITSVEELAQKLRGGAE